MSTLQRVFTNVRTHKQIVQPKPVSVLKPYGGEAMISETDKDGIITYVNRRFSDFVGYTRKELIGMPHAIIRHPDMPKGLYKAMWEILGRKKVWRGYIKSLCKDGSSFWALVYIQPKLDENGEVIGYVANRRDAYPNAIWEVEAKYAALRSDAHIDDPYFRRYELYLGQDMASFDKRQIV